MDISRPIPGWTPSTPEILGDQVDRSTAGEVLAIHFWAPWNGHDMRMDQSIQAVAPRFAGRVRFVSCNVDLPENRGLCHRFEFANVPALGILVDTVARRPIVGYRGPEELVREIESRLHAAGQQSRRTFWPRIFNRLD